MKKLITIALLLISSTAFAAMTEYETKMLQLETERFQLQREATAQAALTGLYQRCAAIRTTSPFITLASCVAQGGTIEQPITSNDQNKPAAPIR
jgi:hypothetical protein